MQRKQNRLFVLAALGGLAACQDTVAPSDPFEPRFAQGVGGVWTVNSLADPGTGACDDAECTLREAIAAALTGDVVTFAPGLAGTILLAANEISIDKSLRIVGPGAASLIIDAHTASRVLLISDGVVENPLAVEISGLTISGGGSVMWGAGVENREALTLRDVVITNNHASSYGGGIYSRDGELTLLNTTVSGNAAGDSESRYAEGGGIYTSFAPLTLVGSTVTANWARLGGGINTVDGELTILLSTVSGNSALTGAGAYVTGAGALLRSSTIVDQVYGNSLVRFANTVVGGCVTGLVSGMTSLGHNVLVACDPVAPTATDIVLAAGQLFTDVLEPELTDHGGPTHTHALLARGRAVDAGYCPAETEDQRGLVRPADHPLAPNVADGCDIGAYELQAPVTPVADLMVSQAVNRSVVKQGELLTYSIRVQNLGPETAPNVVMNDVLSNGVTFVEVRHNKGTHTAPPMGETGTVTWYLGDMLDQENEVAEIDVTVLVKGPSTIINTATVTGNLDDPNEANNTAAIETTVELGEPVLPVANLMVSQAVDKTVVKQGELLTYFIQVQNLGPETAPNVIMNDVLSSGVTFVEARYNKGTHTAPPQGKTGTVTWYLGDMLDQGNEVAQLVVTVLVKGRTTITNTATVTGDVADPNEANNTAAIQVSVGASGKRK